VSFKIPGRVEVRLVDEGELIAAGTLVARLESTELACEVDVRTAETEAAAAALAELEAGSRPEEIAQGEAALDLAQAEADRLRVEFSRQAELYRKNFVSRREYDVTETAYRVAQARVRDARERLTLLRKGPRSEKIAQARARLEQAQQMLALAETRLGYATLLAPLSGVVLSKNVEPGEYVAPGSPVVTVGDLDRPWLRAYIDETDLGRVKLGQEVKVTTDTYPGKHYAGRVSFIASQAEFTPRNVQTEKERVKLVYRIKVDMPNVNMELKPGMPADADILLGEANR
jgi:HlyD family secretion protein